MFVSSFSFFLNLTKKVVNLLLTMGHVTHLEALWYDCAHVSVSGIVLQIWPQEPKHCQTILHQTHLSHRTLTLKLSNPLPYFLLESIFFLLIPLWKVLGFSWGCWVSCNQHGNKSSSLMNNWRGKTYLILTSGDIADSLDRAAASVFTSFHFSRPRLRDSMSSSH